MSIAEIENLTKALSIQEKAQLIKVLTDDIVNASQARDIQGVHEIWSPWDADEAAAELMKYREILQQ